MLIEQFMNENPNWEQILSNEPYNIGISWDNDYCILKYNFYTSDTSNELVQQARGSIFYRAENGEMSCVCRPFRKFFNAHEANAAQINWSKAVVEEKVDGSLMKVWYHNGWHLSTNGTIDAFKADTGAGMSFGELFERAVGESFENFSFLFSKADTYLFELVSPYTRIVVKYDKPIVYYLTTIDTKSGEEWKIACFKNVEDPVRYELKSLEDCVNFLKNVSEQTEGFVVKDNLCNRIKIKSPAWLAAHVIAANHVFTLHTFYDLYKEQMLDDFLGYCPEYAELANEYIAKLKFAMEIMEKSWQSAEQYKDRKVFAEMVKSLPYHDYCFKKFNNNDLTAIDYLMSRPYSAIKKILS